MGTLHLAALVLSVAGVGDTTLLDFGADYCGPCRSMEPVVAQLSAAGYPVRRVNIEQDRALAAQYHVTNIPCFVLVVDGREIERSVGATDLAHLKGMFQHANRPVGTTDVGGSSIADQKPQWNGVPVPPMKGVDLGPPGSGNPLIVPSVRQLVSTPAPPTAKSTAPAAASKFPASLFASVRLKIEDPHGSSYGSGTIIDAGSGEALILTCGHVFRESGGQGKISVDTFGTRPLANIAGTVVHYDLKSDVGLISIRTNEPMTVAKVAPPGYQIRKQDKVFTVGCNHGGDPTVRESAVTSLDKFLGPANVQVAGAPVQGRSGGGLFNADGLVIGVCNAADPADDEGLYAALASVHAELDRSNLAFVYRRPAAGSSTNAVAMAPPPDMPNRMPSGPAVPGTNNPVQPSSERLSANAVYLMVPNSDNTKNEVIVLDRASEAFWKQVEVERRAQAARQGLK